MLVAGALALSFLSNVERKVEPKFKTVETPQGIVYVDRNNPGHFQFSMNDAIYDCRDVNGDGYADGITSTFGVYHGRFAKRETMPLEKNENPALYRRANGFLQGIPVAKK